ncbi:general stress protein 13 [Thermolongibacillus altinsuensis]|uniref:General stress protein 13 n=1 Tax=Thermolongibacillus altinsuensis TaxID=575256 RepID=A0A4R1QDW3_9BACL|nr:general stress protein 13 [Thermolongibacillus altinsuensis]
MLVKWKVGAIVTGKVTGIQPYGVFVSLDEHTQGLVHISEITEGFVKNIYDYVQIGEKVNVKVIAVDEKTNRISLSLKEANMIRHKKIETSLGFQTLKEKLQQWIEQAQKEKQ